MSISTTISIRVDALKLTGAEGEIVFDPFSFELSSLQPYICVIGPSGSGKTTFFKSLMPRFVDDWREFETTDITISIKRNDLNFYETNGRIGYAAQMPFFVAHKTVRENIIKPFLWSGKSVPVSSDVDNILADFYLSNIVDQKAYRLSAGERQRLNLARMFIAQPEIAIIDECFSAMDEELAGNIARVIINKYANISRILVTGHRASDLVDFGHAKLKFKYRDVSGLLQTRRISVEHSND